MRAGLVVLALYLLVAAAGYAQLLPDAQRPIGDPQQPPSWHSATLLGTDALGRSVLWRLLAGARTAVTLAVCATALAVPVGTLMGLLAGWFGGWVDAVLEWAWSVVQSVPDILLITAISYAMGRGLAAMCCAIAATSWVGIMRLVRAEVMRHRDRDYVLAARALGAGPGRLMFAEILPNVLHVAIATGSLVMVTAVKAEVVLTYLGLGMQDGASWGLLIAGAAQDLVNDVWAPLAGAVGAMFLLIWAVSAVGDALRDVLDPRVG